MDDSATAQRRRLLHICTRVGRLSMGFAMAAAGLNAQFFATNPVTPGYSGTGLGIYDVSVYSGYSTVGSSWTKVAQSVSGTTGIPSYSVGNGISASMGLRTGAIGSNSSFAVVYSPSYSRSDAGWKANFMTHSLGLMWNTRLAPRWRLSVGASGITGNFDQLIFSPTSGQALASLLSTGSVVTAGLTPPNQTSVTAPATAAISAQQRLIYGDRMFSAAANAGVSYAATPRLALGFDVTGNRIQHLSQNNGNAAQAAYLVPQTTNVNGSMSIGYSLSPRTSISGSGGYGRTYSAFGHLQDVSGSLGISHRFTRGWYAEVMGGGAYIMTPVFQASTINSRGGQATASAAVGYSVSSSHSFYGSVSRTMSNYYGLGANATMTSTVAWAWRRRGSSWSLQASGSQDRLLGNQVVAAGLGANGYRGTAGAYRMLSRHTFMTVQYAYLTFAGVFPVAGQTTGQPLRFVQQSIQMSLGWGPSLESRIPTNIP